MISFFVVVPMFKVNYINKKMYESQQFLMTLTPTVYIMQ